MLRFLMLLGIILAAALVLRFLFSLANYASRYYLPSGIGI